MNSIIVYRNPLEAWFWTGGALWVLALGAVAFGAWWAWEVMTVERNRRRRRMAHLRRNAPRLGEEYELLRRQEAAARWPWQ